MYSSHSPSRGIILRGFSEFRTKRIRNENVSFLTLWNFRWKDQKTSLEKTAKRFKREEIDLLVQHRIANKAKSMVEGTVKWYDSRKNYGFIEREDGPDVFVHESEIKGARALAEGDKVEFEVEQAPKGPRAKNVKLLEEEF